MFFELLFFCYRVCSKSRQAFTSSALKIHLIRHQSTKKVITGDRRGNIHITIKSFWTLHILYLMRSYLTINCSFPWELDSESRIGWAEARVACFKTSVMHHQVYSVLCIKGNRSPLAYGVDNLDWYCLHLFLKAYPFLIQWEITYQSKVPTGPCWLCPQAGSWWTHHPTIHLHVCVFVCRYHHIYPLFRWHILFGAAASCILYPACWCQ